MIQVKLSWDNGTSATELFNYRSEAVAFATAAERMATDKGLKTQEVSYEEVPVPEKSCARCGCQMIWEHPNIPGFMLVSSCYEPGFELCHECLVEHCMQTNCLQCELRHYPDCEFIPMKKCYLEDNHE